MPPHIFFFSFILTFISAPKSWRPIPKTFFTCVHFSLPLRCALICSFAASYFVIALLSFHFVCRTTLTMTCLCRLPNYFLIHIKLCCCYFVSFILNFVLFIFFASPWSLALLQRWCLPACIWQFISKCVVLMF